MPRWFAVIDGADQGRIYALPQAGPVLIGNSHKHADICLHDLYVGRVHCQLEIANGKIALKDGESPSGTRVNGVKVSAHDLQIGDVVRVGNSHLRLEEGAAIPQTEEPEPMTEAPRVASESKKPAKQGETVGKPAPPTAPGPKKLPHLPLDRLAELTGHELGHFQIGEVLGQGHFGVVFRAHDVRTDQGVALKILSPVFPANDAELRRFVNTMKPVFPLLHPGLISLRGVGRIGPYVWVARELVEGISLAEKLATLNPAKTLKWRSALRLAQQLVPALDFLREHRLVHANITPANILLPADNGPAGLADLGFWDALAGSKLQAERLEPKLLAELPYLSPEHLNPAIPVDDLSDQYCLGAVLYTRLTARPPVEGSTPEEMTEHLKTGRVVRPRDYQPTIPDDLQALVLRMLSKHPEERYPGPEAILADIEKIVAATPEP